jgi:DNA-binding response OmpR family regulator
VDSARVEEVLINLLDNAVRHAPSNSPIRIEIVPSGDKVQIAVTDHGPGIAPDEASLIFQQYERLQPGKGGSGLGLYICRRIVDAHGGHIWLEERPDGQSGARFVFTLPVMPAAAGVEPAEQPAPVVEQPPDGEALNILVVEDEPEFQTLYYAILTEYGYQVDIAADGPTAVDRIMSDSPDLVILDWLLPGMDGLNVLRGIRRWSQTPILLVTSRTSQKDLVTALDAGADDYLTKPFLSEELLARIRALLRRSDSWLDVEEKNRYSRGVFSIDFDSQQIWIADHKIRLSPTEFQILAYLVHNRGQVLTYDQIVYEVWGDDPARGRQDLFVHVSRLRRKLAAALKIVSSSKIRLKPSVLHQPFSTPPAAEGAAGDNAFIETRWGLGYLFPVD